MEFESLSPFPVVLSMGFLVFRVGFDARFCGTSGSIQGLGIRDSMFGSRMEAYVGIDPS